MRAFIVTAVVPNDMTRDLLLQAFNRGIQLVARETQMEAMKGISWSVTIRDEFDLKRQDI